MCLNVIDSHVHFWNPDIFSYSLLEAMPALNRPCLPASFPVSVDGVNVSEWIAVETLPQAGALAEAAWLAGIAKEDKRICAVLAAFSLQAIHDQSNYLDQLRGLERVKGVRLRLAGRPLPEQLYQNFQLLERAGYTCDFSIYQVDIPTLCDAIKSSPTVRFVLNHMGKPDVLEEPTVAWKYAIKELASCPNVFCKVSGVLNRDKHRRYRIEVLQRYFDFVLSQFGTSRVLYAGDWPVVTAAVSYSEWLTIAMHLSCELAEDDRHRFFRENAVHVYGLKSNY